MNPFGQYYLLHKIFAVCVSSNLKLLLYPFQDILRAKRGWKIIVNPRLIVVGASLCFRSSNNCAYY